MLTFWGLVQFQMVIVFINRAAWKRSALRGCQMANPTSLSLSPAPTPRLPVRSSSTP